MIGPLWYDNNPHANIEQKIRKALAHYATAGMLFNVCKVHPDEVNGMLLVDGVRVMPDERILPNHFWFGREMEPAHE